MSRRREAAELARVLLLSTQDALDISRVSPHTLSSPRTTGDHTDDSRDMEMRAVGPFAIGPMQVEGSMGGKGGTGGVDPKLVMGPPPSLTLGDIGSSQSGPSRSTASGRGSGNGGRSTIENTTSTVQTSNMSAIQPFTPTEPQTNIVIPESSEIPSLPPRQPALPSSSSHVPSSISGPPRVSSTEKSFSTGSTSTSRPLFSPTQGSRLAMVPPTTGSGVDDGSPRVNVRHQYSRIGTDNNAGPSRSRAILSSSPPEIPRPSLKKPVRRSRAVLEDSDLESDAKEEEEEEEEEPLETSRSASKIGRPVVMLSTSRSAQATPKPKDNDPTRKGGDGTSSRKTRKSSPDPLLISTKKAKSALPSSRMASLASVIVAETPSSTKSSKTAEEVSNSSKDKGKTKAEPKRRESGRVKDAVAKKEAETLERRRKRAEEKERKGKEEARKNAGLELGGDDNPGRAGLEKGKSVVEKVSSARRSTRNEDERKDKEEPIVILDDDDDEGSEYGGGESSKKKKKPLPPKSKSKQTPARSVKTGNAPSIREHGASSSQTSVSVETNNIRAETVDPEALVVSVDESYKRAVKPMPVSTAPSKESDISSKAAPPAIHSTTKKSSDEAKDKLHPERGELETPTQSTSMSRRSASPIKRPTSKKVGPAHAAKRRRFVVDEEEEDDLSEEEEEMDKGKLDKKAGGSAKDLPIGKNASLVRAKSTSPTKSAASPAKDGAPTRPPLTALPSRVTNALATSSPRHSPGPISEKGTPLRPDGIKFKTERNDLASVLSKFPGSRFAGMSRRLKIAPLHSKIGPPKKELPPAPKKAEKRKKGEESDEDDDEDGEEEEGEDGVMRRKKKEKGLEWFMVED